MILLKTRSNSGVDWRDISQAMTPVVINRVYSSFLVAFAWLKCQGEIEDCEGFLGGHRILTRGGKHFGVSSKYVRISMLDRDEVFELFTRRLSAIQSS